MEKRFQNRTVLGYMAAVGLLLAMILLKQQLDFTGRTPLLLLLPVIVTATYIGGRGPGLLAALLTSAAANYFFLTPVDQWSTDQASIYLTAVYLIEGVVVVLILESVRRSRLEVWEERERFFTTLKSIDDAVLATDTKGCITFINPSAMRFLGLSINEAVSKNLSEVFKVYSLEGKPKKVNLLKKVVRANRPTVETEETFLISSDGKRSQVDYSLSPIRDRGGKFIGAVLIFRDISQRQFVREGMGRMATIVNSSNDAIYSINLAGRVTTWNSGAERLFGYGEAEILGKNLKDYTVPKERAKEYDLALYRLKRNKQPAPFETVRTTKSKETKDVLVSPSPIYDIEGKVSSISVVTTDITGRKKMEQELADSNKRFELATQAAHGLIYDWDLINESVFRSQGLKEVTGFAPDEVPPKASWWIGKIHPEDQERLRWWTSLNFKSKGKYTVNYRFLHKDGHYVQLWDQGIMEKDSTGKPTRVIGSVVDFSEKEEQEQRKNEFISMASHELKTPLTSLKVFTQLLQNLFERQPQAKHLLSRMNDQIDSLTGIVNDLLDVSKIESGKLKLRRINFSLDRLIAETTELLAATNKTHEIVKKGALSHNVFADKERINEVLINLLNNAIKYSPDSDKVELSVGRENGSVVVAVRDFGIGISKKNLGSVFDRFFRVYGDDKTYPGLGMGLYISSEIIKRHHGKMWVESKKGQGSTFYFTIPLKHDGQASKNTYS
ncbi:MAG TPA: PAS domain S-box protein [Candidatus Saccharimonadales bacterium]|nr:PAS domain S-box protein [Candidatus Saccharimonadales bacterium]